MSTRRTVILVALLIVALAITVLASYHKLSRDLPERSEIRSTILQRYPTRSTATWIPLHRISPRLQQAVLTWEDPTFYFHGGFNWAEIRRSVFRNLAAGAYVRGGSTITQQLAKNMYLTPEKTLARKFREALLAERIEDVLEKKEILEIYLNIAEWGPDLAGAEQAALHHLGKPASELDWGEAALLTGMLQNPGRFDPRQHPDQALEKQTKVLEKLFRFGVITRIEFKNALDRASRSQSQIIR